MLKDLKSRIVRFWQEDSAAFTQRVVNITLGVGTAALLIVTSVRIAAQIGFFAM